MRSVCFTIDLDRDANIPSSTGRGAVCTDLGNGTAPRFSSSRKGAELLAELFDELDVETTFFAEARTLFETEVSGAIQGHEIALHGLDHEDIMGKECGRPMEREDLRRTLSEAIDMIHDASGQRPSGFRAPYMRFDPAMYDVLHDLGIRYDSSEYTELSDDMHPYGITDEMVEIPVPKGYDRHGKRIAAYLWQMHEGRRNVDDYIEMAMRMKDGVFVMATHSWHITESAETGPLDADAVERNIDRIRRIVTSLQDDGFEFKRMDSIADTMRP